MKLNCQNILKKLDNFKTFSGILVTQVTMSLKFPNF
jgi:hypothetical protein